MRELIDWASVAVLGLIAAGCTGSPASSGEAVRATKAPLYSVNTPTTVTSGVPVVLSPTCPGHKLPDQCGTWAGVELSASKSTRPGKDSADEHCLCHPIDFQIPASLPVTQGSSGVGQAELQFRKANGHVTSCIYLGNERIGRSGKLTGGDAYDLVACTDGLRAGASASSDWFSLDVHSGDPFRSQTQVQLRLGAPDVVGGVVQEEIIYANDSRVPGAALHVPRGSAPPNQSFALAVLPAPAAGGTIANGDAPFTTAGFALDVHATGSDTFNFAPVPGAACPRIDLPYSPTTLAAIAGAGAEQRLTARQITDLTGLTTGASVLAQTQDVTVDTVNHVASFCVSHLSFYVTGVNGNDDTFIQADIAEKPTRSCAAGCSTGEECLDNVCYVNVTAAKPTLVPSTAYQLRLVFFNPTTNIWDSSNLRLLSMEPRTQSPAVPTPLASSPWFLGPFTETYPGTDSIGKGQNVVFTIPVTSPAEEKVSTQYPFGAALDLCLKRSTVYLSECFSWDPNTHVLTTNGTTPVGLTEVCDGIDNDSNGETDDLGGNVATEPGKPCDNGQTGTCARTGSYVCDGLNATVCDAPIPAGNGCGGCTPLDNLGAACDNGQLGVCAQTGTEQCSGSDAVACSAVHVDPGTEICDGIDNDCNGVVDDGCPAGLDFIGNDTVVSPIEGPVGSGIGWIIVCPNGEFPDGLSAESGADVDSLTVSCAKPTLTVDSSAVPFQYGVSWFADAFRPGPRQGGPGGGISETGCDAPGLMTGIQGTFDQAIVALGIQCSHLTFDSNNNLVETGRYWAGAVGGELTPPEPETPQTPPQFEFGGPGGTPFSYECPAGQYVSAVLGNTVTLSSGLVLVQDVDVFCRPVGMVRH